MNDGGEDLGARLRAALLPSEQLLGGGPGDGLFAVDRAMRYVLWSDRVAELTGFPATAAVGSELGSLVGPEADREIERVRAALSGLRAHSPSRKWPLPAGERWIEIWYSPFRAPSGEVIAAIGLVRDATAQRRVEEEAGETEMRFRNMADASPVLLWMSGTDSLCTFFNQSWLDFTGRELEQEWGVGWAEGVYFEDFQRCMETYQGAFNARRRFEMEYRLRRADGEYRWILDRGVPRYTPDGRFAGFIGSCVDITDRKLLEARLRHEVRERDEFLSIASHELRTPLTTLQIQLDALQRDLGPKAQPPPAPRSLKRAQTARDQTHRLAVLIDTLLDVSRLTAGRLKLERERTELAEVVERAVSRFASLAEEAGCALEVALEPGCVGEWDRARIDQVAGNLLSNAIKYGPGQPVEVRVASLEGRARLTVRDRGIGIAPEDQERIFQRFERAVSSRNYGGFGLGLWIAAQVVDAHGGTIGVESAPGKGALFAVELPLG